MQSLTIRPSFINKSISIVDAGCVSGSIHSMWGGRFVLVACLWGWGLEGLRVCTCVGLRSAIRFAQVRTVVFIRIDIVGFGAKPTW